MHELKGKLIITGKIVAKTGLHVGGSKSSLDIGGIDNNVIKTPQGVPYIPGSSLKGKMRSLLGKLEGVIDIENDSPTIQEIFGYSGNPKDKEKAEKTGYTRLLIRDSFLYEKAFRETFDEDEVEMELPYSDVKWENRINRLTGSAGDPRQMERVPAGAKFEFEMVYSILSDKDDIDKKHAEIENSIKSENKKTVLETHLNKILLALKLLQDDYIGGSGSRGYGKIAFEEIEVIYKEIKNYEYKKAPKIEDKSINNFIEGLRAEGMLKETKKPEETKTE